MKTGDLAKQFGVSSTTISNWIDEFGDFLSDGAKRIGTKQRMYTEDDLIVLATIAKLSAEDNASYKIIHDKLTEGFRVDSPSDANFGVDYRMMPAAVVEQIIDSAEMRVELEQIKSERDRLIQERDVDRKRITELEGKITEYQEKMMDLQYKLGKAEGELGAERGKKRGGWFS